MIALLICLGLQEPSAKELLDAADALYRAARVANALGDKVESFADVDVRPLKDPAAWQAPAAAYERALDAGADRLTAELGLARCLSFGALDAAAWEKARARYDAIIGTRKAVAANGLLDAPAVKAEPRLLQAYFELGAVNVELGRLDRKPGRFDDAKTVFANILRLEPPHTRLWWHCKYRFVETAFEAGEIRPPHPRVPGSALDLRNADYDGNRFGFKAKFDALMEKIRKRPE